MDWIDKLPAFMAATTAILLLSAGCAGSGAVNQITADTTYARLSSPYEARVEVSYRVFKDTTVTWLNGRKVVESETRRRCTRQAVTLRAKPMHHTSPHVSTVEATDFDCEKPADVQWERTDLRSPGDKQLWQTNHRVRQEAKMWLRQYLIEFYIDNPALNR